MAYDTYRAPFNFQFTPWVKRLLIANGVAYLVTVLVGTDLIFEWFAFSPSRILTRPWGAFTYMFVHGGFWHLFFNMLGLFFFGPPLESKWGSREFIRFYMLCGLGGVLLSLVFVDANIVGASAAVFGVMLAFALAWPNAPIYLWGLLPIPAKWLVAILATMTLLSAVGGGGGGVAHMAHLGGLITGFLYLKSDWRPGAAIKRAKRSKTARKLAIVPREERRQNMEGQKSARSNREEEALLDAVDRVLDKISEQGMGSLSDEERKLLDEVSRRRRSN